jgi:hypothetical protein
MLKYLTILLLMLIGLVHARERKTTNPFTENPYAPRGNSRSPNGEYQWIVQTKEPVSYQLIRTTTHQILILVPSYFGKEGGSFAIKYAKAFGIYWNRDSSLVVLDELNYRRAGELYIYRVQDGTAKPIPVNNLFTKPVGSDEFRICADKGWISPTRFSVRAAIHLQDGSFKSEYAEIVFNLDRSQTLTVLSNDHR